MMEASEQTRLRKLLTEQRQRSKRDMTLAKNAIEYLDGLKSGKIWLNSLKSNLTKRKYVRSFIKYATETGLNPDELVKKKPTQPEIIFKVWTAQQEGKKPDELDIDEFEAEHLLEDYLSKYKG